MEPLSIGIIGTGWCGGIRAIAAANSALVGPLHLAEVKPEDLSDAAGLWARKEALDTLALLIGPMMPHLAEELWQNLSHRTLLVETPWPQADAALTVDDQATVAVQVNGKLRATIQLPRDCDKAVAEQAALADPAVQRLLEGKAPKKVVVVPNRIVNIVA